MFYFNFHYTFQNMGASKIFLFLNALIILFTKDALNDWSVNKEIYNFRIYKKCISFHKK